MALEAHQPPPVAALPYSPAPSEALRYVPRQGQWEMAPSAPDRKCGDLFLPWGPQLGTFEYK